ncbi:MAG: hypothetical protein Q4B09_11130 [Lachnospiraceae bacterium]|nr:hypothetical protein [Lachnospiraceae bacterium]
MLTIGLILTLLLMTGLSIWSGTKAKRTESGSSLPIAAGLIIGTLVGGSSTIGTAQLAYSFGMSAWWFTLGAGLSCLVLGLVYAIPLRRSGCSTLVGLISDEYGTTAGMLASVLSSVGTFINIIAQLISASAVIAVVAPSLGTTAGIVAAAVFMLIYVIFGGTKGAGIIGLFKTVLLYAATLVCGLLVLQKTGGLQNFGEMVREIENPEGIRFFSLFARGIGKDAGAGLSLLLGVLTTQTYAQAVLSARTDRDGRGAALLSAFLIPPIGIGGILVGLYMRANAAAYPGLTAKTALTTFVVAHIPPLPAGVILGSLFIAVVGTGAGLALGIVTVIEKQIIPVKKQERSATEMQQADGNKAVGNEMPQQAGGNKASGDDAQHRYRQRVLLAMVLTAACLLSTGKLGDGILQFAFMSMGLRGAVMFLPNLCVLWLPGRVDRRYAAASVVISPAVVLILGILKVLPVDPLFPGILASALIMGAGMRRDFRDKSAGQ